MIEVSVVDCSMMCISYVIWVESSVLISTPISITNASLQSSCINCIFILYIFIHWNGVQEQHHTLIIVTGNRQRSWIHSSCIMVWRENLKIVYILSMNLNVISLKMFLFFMIYDLVVWFILATNKINKYNNNVVVDKFERCCVCGSLLLLHFAC